MPEDFRARRLPCLETCRLASGSATGLWLCCAESLLAGTTTVVDMCMARAIAMAREYGVGVAHNPVSNMKLASGMAPVQEYLAAGVSVGLGTDGEKGNNNLDMFEEMKAASLLAKLRAMDAAALDGWQVLRMATIGGARALRLESAIGSLEPGKKADFIAVRMDTPRMTPVFGAGPHANLHHNLVHAVRGSDVDLVVIDGAASTAYRRWLPEKNLRFGVIG